MKALLLFLLTALTAFAAPAYVQAKYGENFPSTSVTVSFDTATTSGNFLVAGCRPSDGSANVTVAAGGRSFIKVASAPQPSDYSYHLFILSNAPAVTSITMSGGDTSDQQRMWIAEFSGVATTGTVIEGSNTGEGTSGTSWTVGNVTSLTDGALLIMCAATDGDQMHSDPSPSTGWTMINLQTCCDDDKTGVMWRVAGAAGSYTGTMTDTESAIWSTIIGSFKAAAGADSTPPTLLSATIPSAGTTISLNFDESVTFGAGGNGGWTLTMSGGPVTMAYSSGSGSSPLIYTLSRTINSGETGDLDYTQPGNGVEDIAANDLATLSNLTVVNSSSQNVRTLTTGISVTAGVKFQ